MKKVSMVIESFSVLFLSAFILMAALFVGMPKAHALELLAHKSTSSKVTKIDDSSLEKLWASNTPACLKDGSRLMGVNKAFRAKGLKYGDCSSSDNAKEKQRMLGYEVAVIKFVELSDSMARKVSGNGTATSKVAGN